MRDVRLSVCHTRESWQKMAACISKLFATMVTPLYIFCFLVANVGAKFWQSHSCRPDAIGLHVCTCLVLNSPITERNPVWTTVKNAIGVKIYNSSSGAVPDICIEGVQNRGIRKTNWNPGGLDTLETKSQSSWSSFVDSMLNEVNASISCRLIRLQKHFVYGLSMIPNPSDVNKDSTTRKTRTNHLVLLV